MADIRLVIAEDHPLFRDALQRTFEKCGSMQVVAEAQVNHPVHLQSSPVFERINKAGQVVGRAATASGDEHAFLWTAGPMVDLGTLGAAGSRSQAEGINDAGQVVGLFNDNEDHAFYWTAADGMIELPTLTGIESGARAINNAGQIAGYGDISTGDAHAVVWNDASTPPSPEEQIESGRKFSTARSRLRRVPPSARQRRASERLSAVDHLWSRVVTAALARCQKPAGRGAVTRGSTHRRARIATPGSRCQSGSNSPGNRPRLRQPACPVT
jgi:probable HAF family extracellular repeat protein